MEGSSAPVFRNSTSNSCNGYYFFFLEDGLYSKDIVWQFMHVIITLFGRVNHCA